MDKLKQREARQYKTVDDIKKNPSHLEKAEFQLEIKQETTPNANNGSMLPSNVLKMDKTDLLLYVQKLQLDLE